MEKSLRKFRELFVDAMSAFFCIFIWIHLIGIALWGTVRIVEDNPYILWSEIVMMPIMLFICVERLIDDIKKEEEE